MANDIKKDIEPNVLSDVLLTEYVLKKDENKRFILESRWNPSERFYDFIVTCKIALVILALLNNEEKNKNYYHVRLNFEKAVFMDGDKRKFSFCDEVESAMDKLCELIDIKNRELDNLCDQNKKMPWTMASLRAVGVLESEQAILHSRGSVIYMGWAMAWLREVGIIEANPVTLFQFSHMWINNYILINDCLNEFNPIVQLDTT